MVATEPDVTTFRSPFADIDIPEMPLAAFVLSRAQELGSKAALIEASSGRQVTYAQLAHGVRRAAFGLHQRGFTRGDVLALFTPNLPEFAVAYYAVASLGGTVTTINPLATAEELTTQLADSGARWMITAPSCLETALRARGKVEAERVFVFGEAAVGVQPFDALLSAEGPVPQVPLEVRSDVVALPYSSGTTGLPKGVMLTHYNLVANLRQMDGIAPVSERDTVIAVLPFFHIYGMEVILAKPLDPARAVKCASAGRKSCEVICTDPEQPRA